MKKNSTIRPISLLFILGILIFNMNTTNAQQSMKYGMLTFNKAVNISGQQCMLSQKIAKSYLYLIENPDDKKAKKSLLTSKIVFEKYQSIMNQNASYKSTKDKIFIVDSIWTNFKRLIESTPNYNNAKKIITLDKELLIATNEVVKAIMMESKIANQNYFDVLENIELRKTDMALKNLIDFTGRQRMLSQRLALYYFANHAKLKNESSERMLNDTYKELNNAINTFLISSFSNEQTDEKLAVAILKWEQIENNKNKLMHQGFKPEEIYKISNELSKAFDALVGLYEKVRI